LYSFDPKGDGKGGSKLLWKFDGNLKTSLYSLHQATKCHFIAFPAIYDGLVYIAMGEDPEHGDGSGNLWCINPLRKVDGSDVSSELAVDRNGTVVPPKRKQAVDLSLGEQAIPNPDSAVVWHYVGSNTKEFEQTFHRSPSTPVIKDDVLYTTDLSGLVHCLNAKTGKAYWTHDLLAACWGSPLLVDGKVYIADEDGDIDIFRHSENPRFAMKSTQTADNRIQFVPLDAVWDGELINKVNIGSAIYTTPIVANNVLYIATRTSLYAIEETTVAK